MKEDNVLQVYYGEKLVGTLALTADYKAAFQYAQEWLENAFFVAFEKPGICSNERLFFRPFWSICR